MKQISVVIINGKPRSGKDTVISYMRRYCSVNECAVFQSFSTIDPVKNMLVELGWDGEKTDCVRNLLALLKQFWVSNNNGPLKYCIDKILLEVMSKDNCDVVMVFQIREPEEIIKLVDAIKPIKRLYNIDCKTLFIDNDTANEVQYQNSSDNDVANYDYDSVIYNNGTLDDLQEMVYNYMDILV